MSRKREIKKAFELSRWGNIVCPYCECVQDNSDEYTEGFYECDNCDSLYEVTSDLRSNRMQQTDNHSEKIEGLEERIYVLEDRIKRLEKQLGLK